MIRRAFLIGAAVGLAGVATAAAIIVAWVATGDYPDYG
jgi:hypothetical protein